jgi:Tfp pilus assembly protein PilN
MSQQINLFSPLFLKKKHYFSALTMAQALGAVLVGTAAIYAFELRQNATLEATAAATDKQIATQREQLLKLSKEFSALGASRGLAEDLARTEQRLQQRLALLADLQSGAGANADGFARYLEALARQALPGLWLTSIEIGGPRGALLIRGRALDSQLLPTYIARLNQEPTFAGKPIGELQVNARGDAAGTQAPAVGQPSRYVEFTLSIPLRGDS